MGILKANIAKASKKAAVLGTTTKLANADQIEVKDLQILHRISRVSEQEVYANRSNAYSFLNI